MNTAPDIRITICMGSSCFCRGNKRHLVLLQQLLREAGLDPRAHLEGHLCRQDCHRGPNLSIAGVEHHAVEAEALVARARGALNLPREADAP